MSSPLKRFCGIALLLSALLIAPVSNEAAATPWRKAPKPEFPYGALKAFSEGSVTVRAVIAPNGTVRDVRVTRTSGNAQLDAAAVTTVRKWEMEPAAITPADLRSGRAVAFEFKQEAMRAALYRDRAAWFDKKDSIQHWVFAPFPDYPEYARRFRYEGVVLLKVTIGRQGVVSNVSILRSSGHPELDNAAVVAVRQWRAHQRDEGKIFGVPVRFVLGQH
jgi:TonB family protein